jgi:hypothetical protein
MKFAHIVFAFSLPLLWSAAHSATPTHCKNGAVYELTRKIEDVNGKQLPFYHFKGPIGKGLVQSSVPMDVAKEFVCQENGRKRWLADDSRDD